MNSRGLVGNEPDLYASLSKSRPVNWSSSDYSAEFLGWTYVLTRNLSLPPNIFQAGSTAMAPPGATMDTVEIINDGIDTSGTVQVFSQHM